MSGPTGIEVVDLVKSYQRGPEAVRALDEVSLGVQAGEMVALSGPSGSGKSTLLDVLLGWQTADSGIAQIHASDRPGSIGVITQNLALFEELTTYENIWLAARLADGSDPEQLTEQLDITELGDRQTSELSLGQQQRVAVARALVTNPSVVIADEPTSHQDVERAMFVVEALKAAASSGAAVLLTSHDPRILEHCTREIQIAHGRLSR